MVQSAVRCQGGKCARGQVDIGGKTTKDAGSEKGFAATQQQAANQRAHFSRPVPPEIHSPFSPYSCVLLCLSPTLQRCLRFKPKFQTAVPNWLSGSKNGLTLCLTLVHPAPLCAFLALTVLRMVS